jgi:hypothetical protein
MAGDRPVLVGLLLYLLIAVAPTLIFWVVLRLVPAALERFDDRRRVRRRLQAPPGPPIESAVANLRRLRREVRRHDQPTQVRRVALFAAYDALLIEVCACVGVDAPLATAVGGERDLARLITEATLEDAGIALDPPRGGAAAA